MIGWFDCGYVVGLSACMGGERWNPKGLASLGTQSLIDMLALSR